MYMRSELPLIRPIALASATRITYREDELLFIYFTDHLELPPANNKLGTLSDFQKLVMAAMGLIPGSTSAEAELFLKKLSERRSKAGGRGL